MQAVVFIPEEQYNDTYVIHHDKKNWSEAQRHCRENHTDLVSGLDQLLDKNFRSKIQNHGNSFHWIGLFRDSWRWSDGRNASFRNWKSFKDDDSKKCAVTLLPSQKWESCACNQKRPFFCYRGEFNKVVLFLFIHYFLQWWIHLFQPNVYESVNIRWQLCFCCCCLFHKKWSFWFFLWRPKISEIHFSADRRYVQHSTSFSRLVKISSFVATNTDGKCPSNISWLHTSTCCDAIVTSGLLFTTNLHKCQKNILF